MEGHAQIFFCAHTPKQSLCGGESQGMQCSKNHSASQTCLLYTMLHVTAFNGCSSEMPYMVFQAQRKFDASLLALFIPAHYDASEHMIQYRIWSSSVGAQEGMWQLSKQDRWDWMWLVWKAEVHWVVPA